MKIIYYINQFFGGVGGEEKADQEPYIVEGTVGPTMAINGAKNAGLFAVQILALTDSALEQKLRKFREEQTRKVLDAVI